MGLSVEFGNGGSSTAKVIEDSFLQSDTIRNETANASGPVLQNGDVSVSTVAVPGAGKGGVVAVEYSQSDNAFTFDTGWNAVKNAKAVSDTNENVKFVDFVHVDVDFSAAGNNAASHVEIQNLKRGNVLTGSGDDTIKVSLSTNDAGWQNTVDIKSGAGNDTITIYAGSQSGAAKVTDGHLTTVTIDAGAGNDTIDMSGTVLKAAFITGGEGNDTIKGSYGADTFIYGTENTGFDVISEFQVGLDKIQLAAGVSVDDVHSYKGNTTLALSNGGEIKLVGLTISQADVGTLLG